MQVDSFYTLLANQNAERRHAHVTCNLHSNGKVHSAKQEVWAATLCRFFPCRDGGGGTKYWTVERGGHENITDSF